MATEYAVGFEAGMGSNIIGDPYFNIPSTNFRSFGSGKFYS